MLMSLRELIPARLRRWINSRFSWFGSTGQVRMPTNEELQGQIEELKTSLATLTRKLRDVEDYASTHTGLDWGTAGIHSPHPNISVDTMDWFGGVGRFDQNGITLIAPLIDNDELPALIWAREFPVKDASDVFHYSTRPLFYTSITQNATSMRLSDIGIWDSPTGYFIWYERSISPTAAFHKWIASNYPDVTPEFGLYCDATNVYFTVNEAPVWLQGMAADPTTTLSDGMLWYRSDTDKMRLRANGATVNLATETIVTDHTGDTSDAHDASAISVLDAGGNFTGTDVEAVLVELATAGGGSMPMPPIVGTENWHCFGTQLAAIANIAPTSQTWTTANVAAYIPLLVTEDITVVKLWCYNGAAVSGNVNMALYTSAFAQVANSEIGSTAQAGTNVIQEFNITDVALTAGLYYIALVLDNTTGTIFQHTTPTNAQLQSWGMAQEASAFDLPATMTPADVTLGNAPVCGVATRTQVA